MSRSSGALRHRSLAVLLAAIGVACGAARASAQSLAVDPLRVAISAGETHIVSAVAADIDADGDLDVVATDGSLDLIVWVNDGTGHLTRKQPSRSSTWQEAASAPRIDDRSDPASPFAPTDPPSVQASDNRIVTALAAHDVPVAERHDALRSQIFSFRTSRAPPALFLFN